MPATSDTDHEAAVVDFKRWRKRRSSPSSAADDAGPVAPLDVPGYGPPPATRSYDGGPAPASYGIPPQARPLDDGDRPLS